MGFWDEAENAAISRGMVSPSGYDLTGVPSSPSKKPLGNILDLRHPNPALPISSDPTSSARSYPRGSSLGRSIGRTAEFWPLLSWVAVDDQRIVVVEDRRDG